MDVEQRHPGVGWGARDGVAGGEGGPHHPRGGPPHRPGLDLFLEFLFDLRPEGTWASLAGGWQDPRGEILVRRVVKFLP